MSQKFCLVLTGDGPYQYPRAALHSFEEARAFVRKLEEEGKLKGQTAEIFAMEIGTDNVSIEWSGP